MYMDRPPVPPVVRSGGSIHRIDTHSLDCEKGSAVNAPKTAYKAFCCEGVQLVAEGLSVDSRGLCYERFVNTIYCGCRYV